jgi:hypothetical protein
MMFDSPVDFYPLSFVPEGNGVLVGRPDIESYAVLPPDGAELLKRLNAGMTPAEAASWYTSAYGEPVDMSDFLDGLSQLGFLRMPDADTADGPPASPEAARLRWLGRLLFSPAAFVVYALVFMSWLILALRHPGLVPQAGNVFFTRSLLCVQLLIVFGQVPWIFLHEAYHVLAGRRLGLPSKLGFGVRLRVFVVFETRMNGLLTVARRKRYLPFLAGMLMDTVAVCGLEIAAFLLRGDADQKSLLVRILLAMAFPIAVRVAYQFILFLQTDIYFVLATALGCHDLHAATLALLKNQLRRLTGRSGQLTDESQWSERDLRVARWYKKIFVVGILVLLATWLLALLPVFIGIVRLSIREFRSPVHGVYFWDTLLFVALNIIQLVFYFYVVVRNYIRERRLRTSAQSAPALAVQE